MVRFLATILLLAAFAAQTFQKSFIVFSYYTNTTAFSKNCENKSKPKLNCNGKCQLQKVINEEEKKDQQNPERKQENKQEVVSSKSFFASLTVNSSFYYTPQNSYPVVTRLAGHNNSIFHPPSIV
jgi:hypothetical protein